MSEIEFLTTTDVLGIHALQVERFGGRAGLRDEALLESAVAQPQATYDGVFVHGDVFEMAAAYLFHLVSNHPFIDGNKRVGLASALVFLDINGRPVESGTDQLYALTMAVARGESHKAEIASRLKELAGSR